VLAQFPLNDFRLFVGNLGSDVTEQKLAETFQSRYPSFAMARIVYDKNTGESKGYGFVSVMDPKDCAKAIREMNQSWLGSRPIKVQRSDWKERDLKEVRKKQKKRR
jgi:RNA recognition motif-containing protein